MKLDIAVSVNAARPGRLDIKTRASCGGMANALRRIYGAEPEPAGFGVVGGYTVMMFTLPPW